MMIEVCSACKAPRPCRCQRSVGTKQKAQKRWRSKEYLAFVRTLPCCIPECSSWQTAVPHHAGPRGVGEKVDDFLVIPLCRFHHEQAHRDGKLWKYREDILRFQLQTVAAAIHDGVVS